MISPNYPNDYDQNVDCQVTLTFEYRILLVFESFSLYVESSNCGYSSDWLEIHDGSDSDSDIIGSKLCGYDIPSPIESSGKSLTLVFHSNEKADRKGFKIMADHGKYLFRMESYNLYSIFKHILLVFFTVYYVQFQT